MKRLFSKFSGVVVFFPTVELLGTGTTIGISTNDKVLILAN